MRCALVIGFRYRIVFLERDCGASQTFIARSASARPRVRVARGGYSGDERNAAATVSGDGRRMKDYITKLAEHALGAQPGAQPVIPSLYAQGPMMTGSTMGEAANDSA